MLATTFLASLALAAAPLTPHDEPRIAPAPAQHWTYDLASGALAPAAPPALANGPAVDFDNSAVNGFTFLPGPGVAVVDWGTYVPSGTGRLYAFTIGYSTAASGPVAITVRLHAGTTGHCTGTGTVLGTFPLVGLPGSNGTSPVSHTVTVNTRTSGIVVPAGPIGWEYRFFDVTTGPLLVDGPIGLPAPNGTEDAYDRHDLVFGGCSTKGFGGCLPPFLPCASFYLTLTADDGDVAAGIASYGSGINPPGSLSVLSGTGVLGETVVIGVNNPLGTQAPGSIALLFVSFAPAPGFPGGVPLPFFGMSAPGAPSELLLALPHALLLGPSLWAGPAFPSAFPLPIPVDANLIGFDVFLQGVLVDPLATFGIDIALTDALVMTVGP